MNNKPVWEFALSLLEFLLDVIKAIVVFSGIIAANLADFIMGTIAISVLFGGWDAKLYNMPVWAIGLIISLGSSAVQIALLNVIRNKGVNLFDPKTYNNIKGDVKGFLVMAGLVWLMDTVIDVSPIGLLVQNSQYESITWLYNVLVLFVGGIVFILCGFSELLTANIKSLMMTENKPNQQQSNQSIPRSQYQNPPQRPQPQYQNSNQRPQQQNNNQRQNNNQGDPRKNNNQPQNRRPEQNQRGEQFFDKFREQGQPSNDNYYRTPDGFYPYNPDRR